jgi:YXWGXW repeat-containing protein
MRFKTLQRAILAATVLGGLAAPALPQIPFPPPLPGLDVRITVGRPPEPRHERRGPRPGHDFVWVSGFWHWDGGRWDWVPGRWERPAAPSAYWIAPKYIHSEGGYIYEPGHWSNQTVIVGEDIRARREWRQHEREHGHDHEHANDQDRDRYDH